MSAISDVLDGNARWHVEHGSMLDVLPTLPEHCIDACVCDPPYELNFMLRAWDRSGIAFRSDTWSRVFRVLKPGAYLLAFGGTRTSHRIACAIEDAGFEIRDSIEWCYGSGFPKSLNCGSGRGTALKPAHEPIIMARRPLAGTVAQNLERYGTGALNIDGCRVGTSKRVPSSPRRAPQGPSYGDLSNDPATSSGWDSETGRFPANLLLSHSALCRKIGTREVKAHPSWGTPNRECESTFTGETVSQVRHGDGETETVDVFECHESCPVAEMDRQSVTVGIHGAGIARDGSRANVSASYSATSYELPPNRNMRRIGDSGGASRFFNRFEWSELDDLTPFIYLPKPSRAERDAGLEHFRVLTGGEATGREDDSAGTRSPRAGAGRNGGARNCHPTVKSVALMRHLCRLVTPPGGVVLDTFAGSGTTGIAAVLEGFRFVGIELNDTDAEPFVSLARARINHVIGGYVPEPKAAGSTERKPMPALGQLGLFERVA